MQAAVERRSGEAPRVPLDVLVELAHEDFDESFEADGVNLSLGGLSMRAPYLPEVGARLVCRFECPEDGRAVQADAEVVWARDSGSHTGEFGLRFVSLGGEARHRIRRMVVGEEAYVPPSPAASAGRSASADGSGEPDARPEGRLELRLDGVSTPIVAKVLHEDREGVAVEQELPFLRLRTGVELPNGRRGRIETVDLTVEGETPRLILDVSYDRGDQGASFAVPEAEATIPDFVPHVAVGERGPTPEAEDTIDERMLADRPTQPDRPRALAGRPAEGRSIDEQSAREPQEAVRGREPEGPVERSGRTEVERVRPAAEVHSEPSSARTEEPAVRPAIDLAEPTADVDAEDGGLLARLRPQLDRARAQVAEAGAQLGPWVATIVARLRAFWSALGEQSGPRVAGLVGAVRLRFGTVVGAATRLLRSRLPKLVPNGRRRRTTAAPTRESNVTRPGRRRKQSPPVAARGPKRTLLVSALALVGVALGVYALTPTEETASGDEPIELHREVGSAASSNAVAEDPEAGDQGGAATPASVAAEGEPVEPSVPTALGDPSRQAGPMPRPTFPSLREGAQPQDPESLPEGSPYARDVREQGDDGAAGAEGPALQTAFGASPVPNGRSFVIRMSRPVQGFEGRRTENGFELQIPGTLSLDRAGPIASAHPFVQRSMILNRGDHAELTIDFVEGRSPAFRVVARGSALEINIAQQ